MHSRKWALEIFFANEPFKGNFSNISFCRKANQCHENFYIPANCFDKISYPSKSYFQVTVHEKLPVNEKMASSKKTERFKSYRKNNKMLRSSCGISDCCIINSLLRNIRSRGLVIFFENGALRDFAKFTGKYLESLFSNKVAVLRPGASLKQRLWSRYFPLNFAKFLRRPLFS